MKQCRECGTLSSDDTIFCYVCGTKFNESEKIALGTMTGETLSAEQNSSNQSILGVNDDGIGNRGLLFNGVYQYKDEGYSSYLMHSDIYYYNAFQSNKSIDAFYFKGICYAFGYGVDVDLEKAREAYREGINVKNAKCMYGLAVLLLKSTSKSDMEFAYELFCEAFDELYRQAEKEDPISQRMISCYYLFGNRGISKNISEAKKWLVKSAENGDAEAQMNLAHCYELGNVFQQNLDMAVEWYKKSAAQGNYKAVQRLKEILGEKNE